MKRILLLLILSISFTSLWCQEDYALETKYRNPIDTTKFKNNPTLLLFVHSKCASGMCPTRSMQKALEQDSLGLRNRFNIHLYVIYPHHYSQNDISDFEYFQPKDATIAFYTNRFKYQNCFGEGLTTPYIIFYNGKGSRNTKCGGSYQELYDDIIRWMDEN